MATLLEHVAEPDPASGGFAVLGPSFEPGPEPMAVLRQDADTNPDPMVRAAAIRGCFLTRTRTEHLSAARRR